LSYGDFAARQRKWLGTEAAKNQLAFWKQRLEGMPALFEFPMGGPRPASPTFRGARYPLGFNQSTLETLKALSQEQGCSLSTTLLGVFQVLAGRYTDRKDIVLGLPTSLRAASDAHASVGQFAST